MKQSNSFKPTRVRTYSEFDASQRRKAHAKKRQSYDFDLYTNTDSEYIMAGTDLDDAIEQIGRTWEVS